MILNNGTNINFVESLLYSLISIVVVFLILGIICFVVSLLKYVNKSSKEPKKEVISNNERKLTIEDIEDEDMMVAALVATIDYRNEVKTDVRLKSIKKVN